MITDVFLRNNVCYGYFYGELVNIAWDLEKHRWTIGHGLLLGHIRDEDYRLSSGLFMSDNDVSYL